jgi:hypothetical protein
MINMVTGAKVDKYFSDSIQATPGLYIALWAANFRLTS